ncbi:hypothetical protein BD324DRAFT_200472 [Kockovaella imperatae]|uniref:MADS-box domain-containing protein n=1 Tax=Kockovaella imperatae TaxID=4999 RepID=A0A1Y1U8I8_9TREE|nr:hypothetical protein BD324DRAFT_200472 [Kockovaella imperatae]ORX33807.1 hypothetical protein BD324DRAFT_200472 [Kockovaella imperatae]
MGRKKIEIRPLHDERNRNVTFLKRKAGLMKKAWELSVLCGADVSIVIFSAAGKAFEFSSKELDSEIDRYLEYEGVIERRRAPEFAAMAEADEEDDDDDDDAPNSRRGSLAKPGVTKSLKGKESYKPKMHSQAELNRLISRRDKDRGKDRDRERHRSSKEKHRVRETDYGRKPVLSRGIIGDDGDSSNGSGLSEDDEDDYARADKRKRKSRETSSRHRDASIAGLQYAMNMHQRPSSAQSQHATQANGATAGRLPGNAYNYHVQHPSQLDYSREYSSQPQGHYSSGPSYAQPASSSYNHDRSPMSYMNTMSGSTAQPLMNHTHTLPAPVPMAPGGPTTLSSSQYVPSNMQWDPALLARYAEFQLHQNHQRQQRALLEQQRQQLADLGIPVEDKSLLDQLFGNNASGNGAHNGGGSAANSVPASGPLTGDSHNEPMNTGSAPPILMGDQEDDLMSRHNADPGSAHHSFESTRQSFDSNHHAFEWPNVGAPPADRGDDSHPQNAGQHGGERDEGLYKQLSALVNASHRGGPGADDGHEDVDRRMKEEHWGPDDFQPFPSPASAGDLRAAR